jgi:hypothetical protein
MNKEQVMMYLVYLATVSQLFKLYNVEWEDYFPWLIHTDVEGSGRGLFNTLSQHLPAGTE